MSQTSHSPMDADMSTRLRRKIGTKNPTPTRRSGTSEESPSSLLYGPYGRVRGALRRVLAVLDADDGLLLPQVSVNDLGRALSAFLEDARLGLAGGGSSSTRSPAYTHKLTTELNDPELAARVRKNRKAVQLDLDEKFLRRRGGK